jgi:hypothetical protein
MNSTVKLGLYFALTLSLVLLGLGLYSALHPAPTPAPTPQAVAPAGTNEVRDTNLTNQAAVAVPEGASTNPVANATAPAPGAPPTATTPPAPSPTAATTDDSELTVRQPTKNLGRATAYGVAMFFVFIGLAVLLARDISRYFAGRVEDFIFNDNLEGMRDPEYDEAERIWTKGEHLESVRLMRAYLNKHPREQYVALRIAEIYEVDLKNYLAAALEYEEVLKKKLPPERWGWAAIHLSNLYSGKLDKIPEATQLLHRIVNEYGQTAAAKKARERLGIPEPVVETSPAVEAEIAAQQAAAEAESAEAEKPPAHNLPKGFRPK